MRYVVTIDKPPAVEAEIKDAKAERPFDFGLIACGPKPRPATPSPV
jgi:hypothetical protein